MSKFYLDSTDYECPYCSGQLEEDVNEQGRIFRYCEICGKSFGVNEGENDYE